MLIPVTATAPAYWAPYLVNGDASGLEPAELRAADAFSAWLGGPVASCSHESFFAWQNDGRRAALRAGLPDIGGSDCLEYMALLEESDAC